MRLILVLLFVGATSHTHAQDAFVWSTFDPGGSPYLANPDGTPLRDLVTSPPDSGHFFLQLAQGERPPKLLVKLGLKLRQVQDPILHVHLDVEVGTGLVVGNMLARLPADQAGIHVDDILLSANTRPLYEVSDFIAAYEESESDDVTIQLLHKGVRKEVTLNKTLVAQWQGSLRIGVQIDTIPKPLADHLGRAPTDGLFVVNVVSDAPAAKAGIRQGDVLLQAGQDELSSTDDLNAAVQASNRKPFQIKLLRNGQQQQIELTAEVDPTEQEAAATNLAGWHVIQTRHTTNSDRELQRVLQTIEEIKHEISELRKEVTD